MSKKKQSDSDLLKEFREFRQEAKEKWDSIYTFCQARKKFALKKDGQWSTEDVKRMGDTNPHMTFNSLIGYISIMANEAIQQDIGCDVEPRSSGASEELALVRRAQIMALQDMCNAWSEYGFALREGAASGIGGIRQVIKYTGKKKKNKVLVWERINDFANVLFSANASGPGLGEKTRASVETQMTKSEFEEKYGKYNTLHKDTDVWESGTRKKVYEYWRCIHTEKKSYLLEDDKPISAEEYDEMEEKPALKMDGENAFESTEDDYRVEQWILGDNKVLAGPDLFPSTQIPIWLFLFRTVELEGQTEVQSMTVFAEDAQKSKNFLKNVKAMMWAKSPIPIAFVPVESMNAVQEQALAQAAQNGAGQYGVALVKYKGVDDQGRQIPPPRLEQPILTDASLVQEEELLKKDIETAMGVNNTPFLQNPENASGVAIRESNSLGHTATFDGLRAWQDMVQESCRCALEVIERMPISMQIKLAGEDQQERVAWVNAQHALPPGIQNYTIDSNEEYELSLRVRPNTKTVMEQENKTLLDYYKINPQAAQLTGDLFVGNLSFKDSKEMKRRMMAVLPPNVLQGQNPQTQMLQQQVQQLQGQLQALMQQAQSKGTQDAQMIEALKSQVSILQKQMQVQKLANGIDAQTQAFDEQIKQLEVQIKQLEVQAKELDVQGKAASLQQSMLPKPEPIPGAA